MTACRRRVELDKVSIERILRHLLRPEVRSLKLVCREFRDMVNEYGPSPISVYNEVLRYNFIRFQDRGFYPGMDFVSMDKHQLSLNSYAYSYHDPRFCPNWQDLNTPSTPIEADEAVTEEEVANNGQASALPTATNSPTGVEASTNGQASALATAMNSLDIVVRPQPNNLPGSFAHLNQQMLFNMSTLGFGGQATATTSGPNPSNNGHAALLTGGSIAAGSSNGQQLQALDGHATPAQSSSGAGQISSIQQLQPLDDHASSGADQTSPAEHLQAAGSEDNSHRSSADELSLASTDTDADSEVGQGFNITRELRNRVAALPRLIAAAPALSRLPNETTLQIFSYLDKIDSVAYGLAAPNLYTVFVSIHGLKTPLTTPRIGPNTLESAWEVIGREHECKHCKQYRCKLYAHIGGFFPGMEFCTLKKIFGTKAKVNAPKSCYRITPSKPHRCGRHPHRTFTIHESDVARALTNTREDNSIRKEGPIREETSHETSHEASHEAGHEEEGIVRELAFEDSPGDNGAFDEADGQYELE